MTDRFFFRAIRRRFFYLLTPLLIFAAAAARAADLTGYPQFNELSFTYDGRPFSAETFDCAVTPDGGNDEFTRMNVAYTSRDGKLRVDVAYKLYKNYPVSEYAVRLTNLSADEPTGLIDDFRSIDTTYSLPDSEKNLVLSAVSGSLCAPDDFTPRQRVVAPGESYTFETRSGRSSSDYMPFIEWTLDGPASETYHCMLAIGWTGSWRAAFTHEGNAVRIGAGTLKTHFRLDPGETVLQPSVALMTTNLGEQEFRTTIHRFMVNFKSPRDAEGRVIPPVMALTAGGGNKTPEMMRKIIDYAVENRMPFNTFWVDAGWYGNPHEADPRPNCGSEWWPHAGNWIVNTAVHPTGTLLPATDAAHDAGLKFLLWFEPERVQPESSAPVLTEHPDYVHGNLLDLGNPGALEYIQKTVYGIMRENRIDTYREDFNMDPQPIWDAIDAENPERVGLAEARHITGLYAFLDGMRDEFPGLLQENCASGGRRLDMEMTSRAHAYCRSDYFIGRKKGDTAFILGQNATHNTIPYLPFQGGETNCVAIGDDYGMMSVLSSGNVFTPTDFDGGIIWRPFTEDETAWLKKSFDLAARMSDLYMGDFYQLTPNTGAENDCWCAWELYDGKKNEGFAIAFRRGEAPESEMTFPLRRIKKSAEYEVESLDGSKTTLSGKEIANWKVRLEPRAVALVFFKLKEEK